MIDTENNDVQVLDAANDGAEHTVSCRIVQEEEAGELGHLYPFIVRALEAGNRLVLLRHDKETGDFKRPTHGGFNNAEVNDWKLEDFKRQAEWLQSQGHTLMGYGYVCGMSDNRGAFDFDRGDLLPRIVQRVKEHANFDLMTLPRVRSGRDKGVPGYHCHFRCNEPVPLRVLARVTVEGQAKPDLLCELKGRAATGNGSQVVGPGSKHRSGRLYEVEHGDVNSPPVLEIELVGKIIEAIASLDECPPPVKPPKAPKPTRTLPTYSSCATTRQDTEQNASSPLGSSTCTDGASGRELADRYNAENSIEEALERYGYRAACGDYYIHPNNDSTQSVHLVGDNMAHHFGAGDPYGANETSTPFNLFSHFEHGGDWGATVKVLAERYGCQHENTPPDPDDCLWESEAWALVDIKPKRKALFASMANIQTEKVEWLWDGRFALGMLSAIVGDGGLGKGTVASDIIARITTGAAWPNGEGVAPMGSVVYVASPEESTSLAVKPRLEAAGCDLTRVHVLNGIEEEDGTTRPFRIEDCDELEKSMGDIGDVKLVVIDPLGSVVNDLNEGKVVRPLLQRLSSLAERTAAAVLIIGHTNKQRSGPAASKQLGSVEIRNVPRAVYMVIGNPSNNERTFIFSKNNYSEVRNGISFTLEDAGGAPKVEWGRIVDKSADLLIQEAEVSTTKSEDAEEFLRASMTPGVVYKSKQIINAAKERGISYPTLDRTAKKIGVVRGKMSGKFNGEWDWMMPEENKADVTDGARPIVPPQPLPPLEAMDVDEPWS